MALAYRAALLRHRRLPGARELTRWLEAAGSRYGLYRQTGILLILVAVDILTAPMAVYLGTLAYDLLAGRSAEPWRFRSHLSIVALTFLLVCYLLDVYRVHGRAPIERFPMRVKAASATLA